MTLAPRFDLLVLTADDLATLSNRGTVKRAQKEIEQREVTCQISNDPNGEVVFDWSNGIVCRFPAGCSIHDAVCSSGSLGITRHIVRSVLAYQIAQAEAKESALAPEKGSLLATQDHVPAELRPESDSVVSLQVQDRDVASAATRALINSEGEDESNLKVTASDPLVFRNESWDPGTITDQELSQYFRPTVLNQARKRFEQGVMVELTRSAKPLAIFLDEGVTLRFLVPRDLRYIASNCVESQLSLWVPQAIWAFRQLASEQRAGLICIQKSTPEIPGQVLDLCRQTLSEILRDGVNRLPENWPERMGRVGQRLRDEGLVWLAELTVDLLHQIEMYRQHDACFDPQQLTHLLGELTIRSRAIRSNRSAIPQPLIRGSKSDRSTELAGGRLLGVGFGIQANKKVTTVSSYLQDTGTGRVVAVERSFASANSDSTQGPRTYAELAQTTVVRGVSLASLAFSQLLLKSGKQTSSGQLVLPRVAGSLATHPQSFQWEQLKAPFAVESFSELAARLEALPPSALRSRRRTESLYVLTVAAADEIQFDRAQQRLTATLHDGQGGVANLVHPFHARGQAGFQDFWRLLMQSPQQVRFVCGHIRSVAGTLQIYPISVVVEQAGTRVGVSVWLPFQDQTAILERVEAGSSEVPLPEAGTSGSSQDSPLIDFQVRLDERLADLLVTGLHGTALSNWDELLTRARQLGLERYGHTLSELMEVLQRQRNSLDWDATNETQSVEQLCLLSRLAKD